jgi:hypothetical protein
MNERNGAETMTSTMMTQQTAETRATERALSEHITIAARGSIKSSGARFFLVNGARGSQYTVLVHATRLECSCPAGAHGKVCKHRACVHAALLAERRVRQSVTQDEAMRWYANGGEW